MQLVYRGNVLNPSQGDIELLQNYVIGIDEHGTIAFCGPFSDLGAQALLEATDPVRVIRGSAESWLMPGFVDTHIHAPQYLNAGTALDKPLAEWLQHYTYAAEARIDRDPHGIGRVVYSKLVERMIEAGTTLASVFGTIAVESNLVLAQAFQDGGIRGHVGKVSMDRNGIDGYVETTGECVANNARFVAELMYRQHQLPPNQRLVQPVITPRFVPTCTDELLEELAKLAQKHGLRIQSHMCESIGQVEWSKELSFGTTDVQVLQRHGILSERSLMAHCTHSSPADLALLESTGTAIASCPLSNAYFSSERQLSLSQVQQAGVKLGLGSDISGGYAIDMQHSMRWAVGISRMTQAQAAQQQQSAAVSVKVDPITWRQSIYLATQGGAVAMGEQDRCGGFSVGKAFDAQLVELGRAGSHVDWFDKADGSDTPLEELIEKWWCNGTPIDRKGVWVQGRRVRWLADQ